MNFLHRGSGIIGSITAFYQILGSASAWTMPGEPTKASVEADVVYELRINGFDRRKHSGSCRTLVAALDDRPY